MKWSRYNILFYSTKIGYCLFNSRMLSFTRLNIETFDILCKIQKNIDCASLLVNKKDLKHLIETKVIVSDNEDENYLNMLKYRKQYQSYMSKSLGIVVCPTLACNFACPYCYEHNLPTFKMTEETQDKLIKFINTNSLGMDSLTLNWHGGEPLTAFDTIKQIYTKLEGKVKLPIGHSSMVSNGYLLSKEICKYLASKKLDYLQITIDGNEETHNKTRILKNGKSSFGEIMKNIDMATDLMPNCRIGIRTNIGKNNREEYIALHNELSNRWKEKNVSVYHTFTLDNGLNTCESKRYSLELTTEEKNDFEVMLAQNNVISRDSLYPKLDKGIYTCMDCNAYVIDPQGYIYKCWADVGIESRAIGTLSTGIHNYEIVSEFMISSDKFSDEKCLDCSFLPICDGGCNLYRIGEKEKGIPYNVCNINNRGLIQYLETYFNGL
jgi:uncharacterized protein